MSLEPITPEDALELYLKEKTTELATSSLQSHRSRLKHLVHWCNEEGIENLNELSGRDIHRYRLWRRDNGDLSPATEKTQMDTVRVFVRFCESIDAVPVDLSTKVVSPSLSDGENVRDVMLESETAKVILDHLATFEYASKKHVCLTLMWRALLRTGAVRALDLDDYDRDEQALVARHRPDTGTPIKNKERGERFIALEENTCEILDAWISHRRPAVRDEYDRDPLITTQHGRISSSTIRKYTYEITRPCVHTGECPHDRGIDECEAAPPGTSASKCPSSVSPHAVRRGAITHWLGADVPEPAVSERANVSPEIIKQHYDQRSEREKMEQRRQYLDKI